MTMQNRWPNLTTLEALQFALAEALEDAKGLRAAEHDPSGRLHPCEVYIEPTTLFLEDVRLGDGSHVYNIRLAPSTDVEVTLHPVAPRLPLDAYVLLIEDGDRERGYADSALALTLGQFFDDNVDMDAGEKRAIAEKLAQPEGLWTGGGGAASIWLMEAAPDAAKLTKMHTEWCAKEGLEPGSADEMLLGIPTLTIAQRADLTSFVRVWEACQSTPGFWDVKAG